LTAAQRILDELMGFQLTRGLFEGSAGRVEMLEFEGGQVPRLYNEYWTSRQRQGHSLHELSYRACFKAELPRFFIQRLSEPGDLVLDPFMGRGTTPLEAALLGRVPCGNDVNPLSRILLEPRLTPPDLGEIESRLIQLANDLEDPGPAPDEPDLEPFYAPGTLGSVRALRRWFTSDEHANKRGHVDAWLRMVATNRLTGHSKGFFSGRTMPPNQAVSSETQRKLNARNGEAVPERDVFAVLAKKSRTLLRSLSDGERCVLGSVRDDARFVTGEADSMHGIASDSVQLTVTSPPFLNVIDYAKDNWLRCWFNGIDAQAIDEKITTTSKLERWCEIMGACFGELYRVTRPGGWVVFEVGEVRGGKLLLEEPVLPLATAKGFEAISVLIHEQDFTKTANCWGVSNNTKGTNTNRMVLLQKPVVDER
jgi:DNA methylase